MQPILIIAAMPIETSLLESTLEDLVRHKSVGFEYVNGRLGKLKVIVCAGGVGKVNAAAAATLLIERHQPRLVINTGCAGAYIDSGLSVGDLAIASEEVLADEGVIIPSGWKDLEYMELPLLDNDGRHCFNTMPLSPDVSATALQFASSNRIKLVPGRFATVSTCSGTRQRGAELAERWGVIAENMEGAAVAQVCLRLAVDCLEVRGISNMVEERNIRKWELNQAVEKAQSFVLKYLEDMGRNISAPRK